MSSGVSKRVLGILAPEGLGIGVICLYAWVFLAVLVHLILGGYGHMWATTFLACLVVAAAISLVVGAALLQLGMLVRRKVGQLAYVPRSPAWTDRVALFLCGLVPLLVWWAAFFPGCFSEDSINQLTQALSGSYVDWHPTIHTVLVYRLPLALTGGAVWSIILFQLVALACALTYAGTTLMRVAPRWIAYGFVLVLALSPVTGIISVYPWKDVSFAIVALVMTAQAVRIRCSDGAWLRSPLCVLGLALTCALCCLLRHNGVLLVVPLMVVVAVLPVDRRRLAVAAALALSIVVMVRGPLYTLLGVASPGQRAIETLGMPLSALGSVMQDDPEALDADTKSLLLEALPREAWDSFNYQRGFNSVKWNDQMDLDVLDRQGLGLLGMAARALLASPTAALRSPLALLSMVHLPAEEVFWGVGPELVENDLGLAWTGFAPLSELLVTLLTSSYTGLLSIPLWHVGVIEVLLVLVLALGGRRVPEVLLVLPLLLYDVGTSLLLTGVDFRFFWLTYPVGGFLLLALLFGWLAPAFQASDTR